MRTDLKNAGFCHGGMSHRLGYISLEIRTWLLLLSDGHLDGLLADSHRVFLMVLCIVDLAGNLFVGQRLYHDAICIYLVDNAFILC